jgi:RecA-family ATPase
LWLHSRAQRKSLFVDNPNDLKIIISNLKERRIQFAIFDVLNVLHQRDEDKNTEMAQVMRAFNIIRDEVGCQVMVLHHVGHRAQETDAVSGAGRGATATSGFGEFKIRIKVEDADKGIKSIRFKVKAGEF